MLKHLKIFKYFVFVFMAICLLFYIVVNIYVHVSTKDRIVEVASVQKKKVILVLGAAVWENDKISPILKDRMDVAINLYKKNKVSKLLLSGDHGRKNYNEVIAMKKYAMENGVNENDIFMDHAGFSTYESIYRAKKIFGIEHLIISTQKYHLKRALFIADSLNINANGVIADRQMYYKMSYYKFRETFAICKDAIYLLIDKKPTYLGEKIDINGSGKVTNG